MTGESLLSAESEKRIKRAVEALLLTGAWTRWPRRYPYERDLDA